MLAVPLEEWQPEWLIITRSNSRMTGKPECTVRRLVASEK